MPRPASLAVATGIAAAAVLLPDRLRLDHLFPFVDAVAWRPQAALVAGAGAVALARHHRPSAVGLGAAAAAAVAAVARRAGSRPLPPAGADDLTVLCANVLLGRADTGALATLIERERPDLVALPRPGRTSAPS